MKPWLPLRWRLVAPTLAALAGATAPAHAQDSSLARLIHRTRLENGLDVITVENDAVPLATVLVAVRNGAFTQDSADQGMAHLYEHLLFRSFGNGPDAFAIEVTRLNGAYNGATSQEVVYYHLTVPSRNVEKGIKLIARLVREGRRGGPRLAAGPRSVRGPPDSAGRTARGEHRRDRGARRARRHHPGRPAGPRRRARYRRDLRGRRAVRRARRSGFRVPTAAGGAGAVRVGHGLLPHAASYGTPRDRRQDDAPDGAGGAERAAGRGRERGRAGGRDRGGSHHRQEAPGGFDGPHARADFPAGARPGRMVGERRTRVLPGLPAPHGRANRRRPAAIRAWLPRRPAAGDRRARPAGDHGAARGVVATDRRRRTAMSGVGVVRALAIVAPGLLLAAPDGPPPFAPPDAADTLTTVYDASGVRVIQRVSRANDVVAMRLYLLGGTRQLTERTAGIEALLLRAASYGSSQFPGEESHRALARTGGTVTTEPELDWTVFGFTGLVGDLDVAWHVVADRVMHPTLAEQDVAHARAALLTAARRRYTEPDERLHALAMQALFKDHPYALDPAGPEAALAALTTADLKAYLRDQVVTSRMLLAIVG